MSYNKELLRRISERCDEEMAGKMLEGIVVSTDSHGDVTLPNTDISSTMIRTVVGVPAKGEKRLGTEINKRDAHIEQLQIERDTLKLNEERTQGEIAALNAEIAKLKEDNARLDFELNNGGDPRP